MIGFISIFFINKFSEKNFISENALSPDLSDSNDNLIIEETRRISKELKLKNSINYIQEYFGNYSMKSKIQNFSLNGKINILKIKLC